MTPWLYLAAVVVLLGGGFAAGDHWGALGPQKALSDLKAQDWQGRAQATSVALSASQAQVKTLQDTIDRNGGVIRGLTDENTKTAADRDHNAELYRRLLNRPPASGPAGGGAVPEADRGQAAAGPGGAGSGDRAVLLLTDATAECKRNADRLDALSAEVTPQTLPR